uniref:Uncharacterized protein n=1 Tax=Arundo donax TaxID=35708 RepID=A0A0A9GG70_ARUDO
MLATCLTAISQLPSTMICNNLTKCCGVYWNWLRLSSAALRSSGTWLSAARSTTARLGRSMSTRGGGGGSGGVGEPRVSESQEGGGGQETKTLARE